VSHGLFIVAIRVTALQQCRSSPNDGNGCLFGRPVLRSAETDRDSLDQSFGLLDEEFLVRQQILAAHVLEHG
jgi:hypothetical protein